MKKNRLKICLLIIPFIVFIASCFQNKNSINIKTNINNEAAIIKTNSIEGIKIGMSVDEFLKLSFDNAEIKKELISIEGDDFDIYNIYKDDKIIYTVEPDKGKIYRIRVKEKSIKTEKGIGVGNTMADIRKHYKIKHFGAAEGQVSIIVENYTYSFMLNEAEIPKAWWQNPTLKELKDDLQIKFILII